jgi:NitT/TauT family transport system substrate-binding protein
MVPFNRAAMLRGLAAAGVASLALQRPARAQSGAAMRIGAMSSEFAAQPWYASEMGLFSKAGIDVSIEPIVSGAAGAAAVVAGALDICYSNVLSLAIAHNKGIPLVALADANIYTPKAWGSGVLAVKRTSALNSAKSFDGSTIAVGGLHNVLELGARMWLDTNGGDSQKVNWIEIPDPAMEAAVLAGRVDAAMMSAGINPDLGKADYPIRIVAPAMGAIAPTYDVAVWVTSVDWFARNPALAKQFTEIMRTSANWANTHHHETAQILAKYTKRPAADIEASIRYIYGTNLTPASLQPQIDAASRYGWLSKFPARELIPA